MTGTSTSSLQILTQKTIVYMHMYMCIPISIEKLNISLLISIHCFLESDSEVLTFPTSLKGNERKIIHEVITSYGKKMP